MRTLRILLALLATCACLAAQLPTDAPDSVDTIPANSVCSHLRGFAGPCLTVHGRLQTYSDNVIIGLANLRTGHDYEVQSEVSGLSFPLLCFLPPEIYDLLAHAKIVYGDFVIRPLSRDRKGWMGYACIASASHVVARPGGLDHPLVRPRSP